MDLGTAMSVAQALFAALQCAELKRICSLLGYKSDLKKLKSTVETIKTVFLKAEAKQDGLAPDEKLYVERLKDAVYDADDLIDEFVTLAAQRKLTKGNKVRLLPLFKELGVAFKMSRGVEKIRERLADIAKDKDIGSGVDLQLHPSWKRREETCSYVYDKDIIGRDDDLKDILGVLLDTSVQRDFSFLSIVGMGGLGKTALAQLVYNDERVKDAFPLRMWACISDQDPGHFDKEAVLRKMLASVTGENDSAGSATLDAVQSGLRDRLKGRKCLLVLDDVWTEKRDAWVGLVSYLKGCGLGSWILVTTRSKETATIVGSHYTHDLQSLSDSNSKLLFKRTAFESEQVNLPNELVEIGQKILKKCANVPLAIKTVGGLLYGQDENRWRSFENSELAKIRESQNDIMPILKLSYHHLPSPLKSCFNYCAIFPKDFDINKSMLIDLWLAQDFVLPLDGGQSSEDAAEEYFNILLRRCFFQDVKIFDGEVYSCKIHDLMHDLAEGVAGNEICKTDIIDSSMDGKVRHVSVIDTDETKYCFNKSHIRTFVKLGDSRWPYESISKLLANYTCLRTLSLRQSDIEILPASIGNLLHLRFLDLSYNLLEALPESITKLHNLQVLHLEFCELEELPRNMNKLVKLRVLNIRRLTKMPPGLGKLACLQTLPVFVMDEAITSWKQCFKELEALTTLHNLKGDLIIKMHVPEDATYVKYDPGQEKESFLSSKRHLKKLHFWGKGRQQEEALLEELKPHSNLKRLILMAYGGVRMPGWGREDNWVNSVPNLVHLYVERCGNLRCLPSLGKMRHLKSISLYNLPGMEYLENHYPAEEDQATSSWFPSLEYLSLLDLRKLKGWWREKDANENVLMDGLFPSFPRLTQLKTLLIRRCSRLASFPLCPNLKNLELEGFNRSLGILERGGQGRSGEEKGKASTSSSSGTLSSSCQKLRKLDVDDVLWLQSQSKEAFQSLTEMEIIEDKEMESLSEAQHVFQSCSSSLRILKIQDCTKLRGLTGGLEYLSSLESLSLWGNPNLTFSEEDGVPWQPLHQSLRVLRLADLSQLVNLPEWMQHLRALQSLEIVGCYGLESLPNWMCNFTFLEELTVRGGSAGLVERCQRPSGEDWPNIQHIPRIYIKEW